jgi:Cu(I)/Ag(I) efflux system membrane fusion protein
VTLEPEQVAAIGLASAPGGAARSDAHGASVGIVALDETRTTHVHAKVRGWIDTITADFVGRAVRAGRPLCTIYSQDVYAAEAELVSLLDRPADDPAGRRRSPPARALGRVPKSEIARLEATRVPRRTFALLAPRSGVIVAKAAIEGAFVDPATELYTISDLSRLWVLVDLYEGDAAYVHVGDRARLTIEGQAHRSTRRSRSWRRPSTRRRGRSRRGSRSTTAPAACGPARSHPPR